MLKSNRTRSLSALVPLAFAGSMMACGEDPAPKASGPSKSPVGAAAKGLDVLANGSAGAGGNTATPPPPPPPPAAPASGAEDEAEIAYVYSPIGKRDPFRSLFDQFQQGPETEELTELQKFEIDQLKLVGIVSRIATPYALVEDPNGKGHTLTRGKLIGKNWGRVSAITPDCVIIKEEYREYTGRKVTNKTDMCIPKPADLEVD